MPLVAGIDEPGVERINATGNGVMKLRRTKPTRPSTLPLSLPFPGRPSDLQTGDGSVVPRTSSSVGRLGMTWTMA
jgi:hypothetical protein